MALGEARCPIIACLPAISKTAYCFLVRFVNTGCACVRSCIPANPVGFCDIRKLRESCFVVPRHQLRVRCTFKMLGPESAILDEPDNLADVASTNLCATSFEKIPVAQPEPQAQALPPLEPTTKKKKRVKTEKDFLRDRARQANVGRNIQMAKILDEHGIDSPQGQGVRDFFF